MSATGRDIAICRLEELEDPGSRGMTVIRGGRVREMFIVRQGDRVHGYLNSCPHTGAPLDWQPDRFLSPDNRHIQCATHAALFRVADGVCVAGPCTGGRLTALPVAVVGGEVVLCGNGRRERS
ncbi:MAG: Rieske (2Fe-2S) protein [Gammaproteobacteria bacterium]|jgi:nitrite reductase/ring-hydroxylating ferredoxin subunit